MPDVQLCRTELGNLRSSGFAFKNLQPVSSVSVFRVGRASASSFFCPSCRDMQRTLDDASVSVVRVGQARAPFVVCL